MNEDDADQGTGLDTKYRIDSAQGMFFCLSLSSCPPYPSLVAVILWQAL